MTKLSDDSITSMINSAGSVVPSDAGSMATPSTPSVRNIKKTKKEKRKGKTKTTSHLSAHLSLLITSLMSQCVNQVTPAVTIVKLHSSIQGMTDVIQDASKFPDTAEDKAAVQCQEAV